jgi:thioesterase domain-containing protein
VTVFSGALSTTGSGAYKIQVPQEQRQGPRLSQRELRQYLHDHIPLSKAMGVQVVEASPDGVTLAAPLAPNINHRETVFGGSASAVAMLAAWALLRVRLEAEGINARVVIQSNAMSFEKPITADFIARCAVDDATTWNRFIETLRRRHWARMHLTSTLFCREERVALFEGDFVAVAKQESARS